MYQTPKSEVIAEDQQQTSVVGKWLALLGALFVLALPIGMILTIFSMTEIFQTITLTDSGDPKVMAGGISQALVSTVLGVVIALPGVILLAISVLIFKHRRPWVYRVSLISAIFALLLFPIGTIIAIVILINLVKNKTNYFLETKEKSNKN